MAIISAKPFGFLMDPGYPLGILALDLAAGNNVMKGVWDLRSTAGRTQPTTNTYVRAAPGPGVKPAGWSEDPNGILYPPTTASWPLSNWNMQTDGAHVFGRGAATLATITQNQFGRVGGSQVLVIADDSLAPASSNYLLDRNTIDGTGMTYFQPGSGGRAAMIISYAKANITTINNQRSVQAPLAHFKHLGAQLFINDSFYGQCGFDPDVAASHLEAMFIDRADAGSKISRTLFDPSGYLFPTFPVSGITSTVYCEGQLYGDVILEFEQCAITLILAAQAYAFQLAARAAGRVVQIHYDRCAVERGASGFRGITELAGGLVTVTSAGSVNLRTGANVDALLAYP